MPLHDVKLDLVALLQALISIELNRAVVNKDVRTVVPADEAVTLRIVEPLDFSLVLSHLAVDLP